jgi:hypothetical protein
MSVLIYVVLTVAYMGAGATVSRFLVRPWATKVNGGYDSVAACLVVLCWPAFIAMGLLLAVIHALGWLGGGAKDDERRIV